MALLANDACLARGLGYAPPKVTAVREFLERFHDPQLEKAVELAMDQLENNPVNYAKRPSYPDY